MKRNGYKPGPTRSQVLKLHRKGLGVVAISRVLGISHQSVSTHVKELRRAGLLKETA